MIEPDFDAAPGPWMLRNHRRWDGWETAPTGAPISQALRSIRQNFQQVEAAARGWRGHLDPFRPLENNSEMMVQWST